MGIDAIGYFPVNQEVEILASLGLAQYDFESKVSYVEYGLVGGIGDYYKGDESKDFDSLGIRLGVGAQYNITELKADHDRLQMLKTETDKAKSEADIYMRLLSEDVSIMLKYWKKINSNNALFEQLIEVLNSSIPGPY